MRNDTNAVVNGAGVTADAAVNSSENVAVNAALNAPAQVLLPLPT